MLAANRAQDDVNEMIDAANRRALGAEDTGVAIHVEMQKQTDKMKRLDKEVDTLNTHTRRAKKEVNWFFRRLATDKLCIALVILILLGAVALIFWRIYSRRSGKSENPLEFFSTPTTLFNQTSSTAAPPDVVTPVPPLPPTTTMGVVISG
jgi:hypothetical protein